MDTKKYKTFNHAKAYIRYHLVFSTKYRKNCLTGIKTELFEALKMAEEKSRLFRIRVMEIDKNHIHFLISIKPDESISNVVKTLKQFSTYYIWKNKYEHMRQYYWKKPHYLWTRGYFIKTVGDCDEEKIKKYIENQ